MQHIFDDTYTGPRWTYGCSYRPPGYAQIPDGWLIGSDRPHPDFEHGTIQFPRRLSERELTA